MDGMHSKPGRRPGILLTYRQVRKLKRFLRGRISAYEFRRAAAILMRTRGTGVDAVAATVGVTRKSVSEWTRRFIHNGIPGIVDAVYVREMTANGKAARKRISELMKKEPKLFGFLKGRWVLGDLPRQLGSEGIDASVSTVWRLLVSLGLVWKRPKLRAPGSIKKDYRKRREIAN